MAEKPLTPVDKRRQAALLAMARFADKRAVSGRNWLEIDGGDVVTLVGFTDEGARFAVDYKKATRQEIFVHG